MKFAEGHDIPVSKFVDIYASLSKALGYPPVVIGGRAVNILCFRNTRPTNDLDFVLKKDPENSREGLIKEGFLIERDGNQKIKSLKYNEGDIKIDLYYLRPINGLSIKDIVNHTVKQILKNKTVEVASPAILILMKFDAGREKDLEDVDNLLRNYYHGSHTDFSYFFAEEKKLLDSLLNEHGNDGNRMNKLLAQYQEFTMRNSALQNVART